MSGPVRGPGGIIYNSALGMRQRGAQRRFQPTGGPYRAIVVETYVMGNPDEGVDPTAGASGFITRARVECDVILIRSGLRINRVPVLAKWGLADAEPWVPKKTTRTLSQNEPLNLEGPVDRRGNTQGASPTRFDDIDGDIVLVDFIEGDFHFPAISGAYPHQTSHRPIVDGDGWSEDTDSGSERGVPHSRERYVRFAGFEFRVNAQGDVLLDTVGATSDDTEAEDPAEGGGHLRFRLKETRRLTVEMDGVDVLEIWKDGDQVRIDLGEGATERLLMGDAFRTFFNDFRTHYLAHTHGTGVGPTSTLLDQTQPELGEDLLSDLARTKKT